MCQAVGVLGVLRIIGQGKGTSLVMSGDGGMQILPGQYMGGGLCRIPGALRVHPVQCSPGCRLQACSQPISGVNRTGPGGWEPYVPP